jgi:hypothetical protein
MMSFRKLAAAFVMAGVMAGGFGVVGLEAEGKAKGKTKGQDAAVATCTYLKAIIDYDYADPAVLVYAYSLYSRYNCNTVLATP